MSLGLREKNVSQSNLMALLITISLEKKNARRIGKINRSLVLLDQVGYLDRVCFPFTVQGKWRPR